MVRVCRPAVTKSFTDIVLQSWHGGIFHGGNGLGNQGNDNDDNDDDDDNDDNDDDDDDDD